MKKYFDSFRKCILFDEIEDENLLAMLGCVGGVVKEYKKDDTVMHEGDTASKIGIVLSGEVRIVRVDYYGNRSILANMRAGEMFAETFACAMSRSLPVSVVANAKSEIMLIDVNRLLHTCSNACEFHSKMIYNLLRAVATKNLVLNQKIEVTSKRTTREKLMAYLVNQAKINKKASFDIPYDRQELADYLEVDRSGLSAEISKLRKEGVLQSKGNHFVILINNYKG